MKFDCFKRLDLIVKKGVTSKDKTMKKPHKVKPILYVVYIVFPNFIFSSSTHFDETS